MIKRQGYNEQVSTLPYNKYNVTTNTKCRRSVTTPVFPLSHCPETKYGGDHSPILHHTYQHSISDREMGANRYLTPGARNKRILGSACEKMWYAGEPSYRDMHGRVQSGRFVNFPIRSAQALWLLCRGLVWIMCLGRSNVDKLVLIQRTLEWNIAFFSCVYALWLFILLALSPSAIVFHFVPFFGYCWCQSILDKFYFVSSMLKAGLLCILILGC